jgi:hypothetical protein
LISIAFSSSSFHIVHSFDSCVAKLISSFF